MHRCRAAVGLLLISLSACGKEEPKPRPAPVVTVSRPLVQEVTDWNEYVGRFESIDAVELRPRVSGYLTEIAFRDGQRVSRGQLLFAIDPRPYRAALDQARAQTARARATLNNARVELERAEALVAAQATSQQQLEARRAAFQQAQADVGAAQANERLAALNLSFTRITAPIAGRISDRRVAPGNLVVADQTVLTSIVNTDPIRFGFEASEALYVEGQRGDGFEARPGQGAPVEIRIQGETDYRLRGRLEFVDNQVDPNSGVIRGRAVVPNPGNLLTPGMFGHMRMGSGRPYRGMLVPDEVVQSDQNRQVVLVVAPDGTVRQRAVQPGPLVNGLRVIRGGLGPADRVVIAGLAKAKPGTKVQARAGRIRPGESAEPPAYTAPPASAATVAAAS
jgi:RND family efflux transporter MFP subunit